MFDVTVVAGEVCDRIFGMGARGLSSVKIVIGRVSGIVKQVDAVQ